MNLMLPKKLARPFLASFVPFSHLLLPWQFREAAQPLLRSLQNFCTYLYAFWSADITELRNKRLCNMKSHCSTWFLWFLFIVHYNKSRTKKTPGLQFPQGIVGFAIDEVKEVFDAARLCVLPKEFKLREEEKNCCCSTNTIAQYVNLLIHDF